MSKDKEEEEETYRHIFNANLILKHYANFRVMKIKYLIISPLPCSSAAIEVHVQLRSGLYDGLHLRLLQVVCSI